MHPITATTLCAALLTVTVGTMGCSRHSRISPEPPIAHSAPSISEITNQTTLEDLTKSVVFTVSDPDTPLDNLRLSALSSDPVVVVATNIIFEGIGTERKAIIQPTPHAFGRTTITINVSDGLSETNRTFQLMVYPVTEPPTITVNPTNQLLVPGSR
jgi:hypothetical protein